MNMSLSFVGQINLFAGNITPKGWLECNGQQLAIEDHKALFAFIGTTFGGDGLHNFNLPNIPNVDNARYLINSADTLSDVEAIVATIGEICLFPETYVPKNWIKCDGTQLPIPDYGALYELIGGKFGHTKTTFSLPSIPTPLKNYVYAICHNGAVPWGEGSLTDITFEGTIGAIQLYPTPDGFQSDTWALCNGQGIDLNSNNLLYTVIGPKWGNANGKFNVPTIEGPAMGINYIICKSGIYPSE